MAGGGGGGQGWRVQGRGLGMPAGRASQQVGTEVCREKLAASLGFDMLVCTTVKPDLRPDTGLSGRVLRGCLREENTRQ